MKHTVEDCAKVVTLDRQIKSMRATADRLAARSGEIDLFEQSNGWPNYAPYNYNHVGRFPVKTLIRGLEDEIFAARTELNRLCT